MLDLVNDIFALEEFLERKGLKEEASEILANLKADCKHINNVESKAEKMAIEIEEMNVDCDGEVYDFVVYVSEALR